MALFTAIADEFKVNDTEITVDTFTNPDVGVLSDGSFIVVWEEPFRGNLGDIDIRGRRFSSDGTPLGESFEIADGNESETQPAIAVTANGRFVVTYVKENDIFVKIFEVDGSEITVVRGETEVSDFQPDKRQFAPEISIDPEGDFVVVWTHEFDDNDTDIRGRFFEFDGTPLTDDIAIANSENNEREVSLATIPLANNDNSQDVLATVVTFTSDVNGDEDIFFTLYGNEGNELVSPVNAVSESDANQEKNQKESSVAIDSNGNFVISWTNEFASDDEDVVLRRFSAEGNALDEREILVDDNTGSQNNSAIALAEDGTIVVAYEDNVNNNVRFRQFDSTGESITDSETYDVNSSEENNPALAIGGNTLVITADDDRTNTSEPYARVFEQEVPPPLFTAIADEFKVNTSDLNRISNPDVGVANNGNFVIVWEEVFEGNSDDIDIRFRRFSANGTPLDDNDVEVAFSSVNETQPAIAVTPDGDFVVTYVKNNDIYVRLVGADGTPKGNEILVSTFEQEREQFAPDIAIDSEGDFAVIWTHEASDDTDIRGRTFAADGTPLSDDIAIAESAGNETEGSLAAIPIENNGDNSDIFAGVVTFTSDIDGDKDIFFSFFGNEANESVSPQIAVSNDNLTFNQRESSVAIDNNGDFVISWTNEFASDDEDIVIRRFSADGNPLDDLEIAVDDSTGKQNNSTIALAPTGNIVVAYEDEEDNSLKYRQFDNRDGQPLTDSLDYGVNSGVEQNPALAIAGNTLVITADDQQGNTSNPYARVLQDSLLTSPINRFQNNFISGTYLFAGEAESQSIRENFSDTFTEEGRAFRVSFEQNDDLVRFNRFRNNFISGTYIFASEEESVSIRENFSDTFTEEGIAFYTYGADANLGEDVIRFRNANNNTYLFALREEANSIRQNFADVFVEEGVAFQVG